MHLFLFSQFTLKFVYYEKKERRGQKAPVGEMDRFFIEQYKN